MRLTCPNCGAEYETPDGMLPEAGRHVQCSACHTRWFARGEGRTAPSEEQILTRLENWSPRPRPVLVSHVASASPGGAAPEPALDADDLVWDDDSDAPAPAPAPVLVSRAPERRESFAKPADRPTIAQPSTLAGPAPAPSRPAPRLELGDAAHGPAERRAPPRSRFFRGLLIALVGFLIAFGAYRWADLVAARVPATAPALAAYETMIDDLRTEVELRLEAFRDRGDG
jgi:predicted Zn finger-like uncharacterized protein